MIYQKKKCFSPVLFMSIVFFSFLFAPAVSFALTGGPDAFGYTFTDSTEPGGPAYNFEDISGTGTPVVLGDDDVSGAIPIGFGFSYYGVTYPFVYISSNGFLTFLLPPSSGCCTGQPLPTAGGPDGLIAGWWEDLDPPEGGTITYETLGTAPNRRFIVQFQNIVHWWNNNPCTFEFKLFETSGNIEVHYNSINSDGGTHSAGIENQAGNDGLQYYLGPVAIAAFNPLAVLYSPPPPAGPVATIPTMTEWGMIGFMILAGLLAVLTLRKRRI